MEEYKFPQEVIPDDGQLFRRIPPCNVNPVTGEFSSAFDDIECSVDWDRYSTPKQTLFRIRKRNTDWGLVRIQAGYVRSIEGQQVVHRPRSYPAHSQIEGEKSMEICDKIYGGVVVIRKPGQITLETDAF